MTQQSHSYVEPKEMKTDVHVKTYTQIFKAALFIRQKWKEVYQQINEKYIIHTYNGILFGNKKEYSTNTCYNMDKSSEHCVKWKKPATKSHILLDSINMKCPE